MTEDPAIVLREILDKLTHISSTLEDISHKLDNVSGIYGIDDVMSKLDQVTKDITGDLGYTLTDLFKEVSELNDKSG